MGKDKTFQILKTASAIYRKLCFDGKDCNGTSFLSLIKLFYVKERLLNKFPSLPVDSDLIGLGIYGTRVLNAKSQLGQFMVVST